jgi:hypothetical protein
MHLGANPFPFRQFPGGNIIMSFRSILSSVFALTVLMSFGGGASIRAQELPPPSPVTLDCAVNASSQLLGATPVGDGSESLVLVRIIFGPGGSIGAHAHPGTLAVVVESGSLGFTLLDEGPMNITRAATADSEAVEELLVQHVETTLNPGDGFIEIGMVHSAENLSDGQTTVLFSGLVATGQPVTACAEPMSMSPNMAMP